MRRFAARYWVWIVTLVFTCPTVAQETIPTSESLDIRAAEAVNWTQPDGTHILQLTGPIEINVSGATLSAERGVVWLRPEEVGLLDARRAEFALIGNAVIRQGDASRSGDNLFATATVRGRIRVTADRRIPRDASQSELYQLATDLRAAAVAPVAAGATRALPATQPGTTVATTQPIVPTSEPIRYQADLINIPDDRTPDGKVYITMSGQVLLIQQRANGDLIELQAERAILFTPLNSLRELENSEQFESIEDAVESAYLEGDVRVNYTPAGGGEQRLRATRVYYDFLTDRAILTDAVLHAADPRLPVPVIVRANTLRQLSLNEFETEKVKLTTSGFATPSYSINADRAYVRRVPAATPGEADRFSFTSSNATINSFGVPVFWLPYMGGSVSERGTPLRELRFGSNNRFGFYAQTGWGLFETLGRDRPDDFDAIYRLDYYSDRGPAGGFDFTYGGGFVRETTKDPWTFEGEFTSFFVHDTGEDDLGGARADVEPEDTFRGRALWQHQHFFPDDWQLQLRAGWVSDATFLEQWFDREWDRNQEHDLSAYLKRQRDTEALTLLADIQPNDIVTTSEMAQEQFEIERLPEIGYHRIGDSFWENRLTFFSNNTVSALEYAFSDTPLNEQGYYFGVSPGLPSQGRTGTTGDTVYRGDFRQEIDMPISLDQIKLVPYIVGRYTAYSDSPADDAENRLLAATGVRITTAFFAIDDTVRSRLFDLNRLRHVIEPEINLFASASNVDANEVFIFDEDIDRVSDVEAAQIGVRQRWQTKRGGPGRWRNVDFFTLGVFGNFFTNQPDDVLLAPEAFRGQYYYSFPEVSIPRNSVNADASWRISDTTVLLADSSYNLDENELATASIGLAVRRDTRLSYFAGVRYINELDSNIVSLAATYELSFKYTLSMGASFGLGEDDERTRFTGTIIRRFDRFSAALTAYYDEIEDLGGINFSIVPEGLGLALGTRNINSAFGGDDSR